MPRTRRGAASISSESLTTSSSSQSSSSVTRSISTEEIREYLECPICYHVPRPGAPIFACAQGHMICSQCRPQIETCPICRISITEENQQRLYFAERLLEDKIPAQCKFNHLGCQVELIGHLLAQHENGQCPFEIIQCDFDHRGCSEKIARAKKPQHLRNCQFRLVDCPIPDCKNQVVQNKLVAHLKEMHGRQPLLQVSNQTLFILFLISVLLNLFFMFLYTFFM